MITIQCRVPFLAGVLHYSMYTVMYSHEITVPMWSCMSSPSQSVMKPIATRSLASPGQSLATTRSLPKLLQSMALLRPDPGRGWLVSIRVKGVWGGEVEGGVGTALP